MPGTLVVIYIIVSVLFAICSLSYVAVDIVVELIKRKKAPPVCVQTVPAPEPKPVLEPEPMPEIIETIPVEIPSSDQVEEGVEVIDVAWPESLAKNRIYKYDPNGQIFKKGDAVLVPTYDKHRNGDILRTATVVNGNYRIAALPANKTLKKVVPISE